MLGYGLSSGGCDALELLEEFAVDFGRGGGGAAESSGGDGGGRREC
jgi:hypothetical protein